jgi:hypothetical protein
VEGTATDSSSTAQNYGGYFQAAGKLGVGVYGESTSLRGVGVYGYNSNTSATFPPDMNSGGLFQADSPSGVGVYGLANHASGSNTAGFFGTNSSNGYSGYFQGGSFMITTPTTNDDPNYNIRQARVATTVVGPTNLLTIPLNDNSVYLIEARIAARRTGGAGTLGNSAGYIITGAFKRTSGGGATLIGIGTTTVVFEDEDEAGWNPFFSTSVNNVTLIVSGADGDVTWHATVKIQNLSN